MTSKITLYYLDSRAAVELARMLLAAGQIPYEDKKLSEEEWVKFKPSTPFLQMPVLEVDGDMIAQSVTIARLAAKLAGLAGDGKYEEAQADMVVDHCMDAMAKFYQMKFADTSEEKSRLAQAFVTAVLPQFLQTSGTLLSKRGGKFFVGGKMSWADVAMGQFLDLVKSSKELENWQDKVWELFDSKPQLETLRRRVREEPNITVWITKNKT